MLDFDFAKVLVIFVLALVVLGPEKLPRVAAQVGRWIGRARSMARQFREQLEEEVSLEEARKAQKAQSPKASAAPTTPTATPATSAHTQPQADVPVADVPVADAPMAYTPVPQQSSPQAEPEQQIVYPDSYSHAHPTDSEGRPISAPTSDLPPAGMPSDGEVTAAPAFDPRQQDWVGGVTGADKPSQNAADAAYAPSHERGT